ncbi:hypothetical protein B0H14DRAFT_3522308 [Mycena olivaceomarginata]|nr:hypothetical protein B0H14DRAFT_3522308 [Mycena olivaceomarginata]
MSTLHAIIASPLMQHISPISKLTALTALSITILCESQPVEGMRAVAAALGALHPHAAWLEGDWVQGSGARAVAVFMPLVALSNPTQKAGQKDGTAVDWATANIPAYDVRSGFGNLLGCAWSVWGA